MQCRPRTTRGIEVGHLLLTQGEAGRPNVRWIVIPGLAGDLDATHGVDVTADALTAEAALRASADRFFGHIAYASLLTHRPN